MDSKQFIRKQLLSVALAAASIFAGCSDQAPLAPAVGAVPAMQRESRPAGDLVRLSGQLIAVDTDSRTLTLAERPEKLILADGARIVSGRFSTINSRLTIKDLSVGQYVQVEGNLLDRETIMIETVTVSSRSFNDSERSRSATQ